MQGIEAGADLHPFYVVNGFSFGEHNTAQVQGRTAVGEVFFNDQIFCLLGVDEGGGVGVAAGDDGLVVFESICGKHFLYLGIGTGGDLVDHAPGEGNGGLVVQVAYEVGFHQTGIAPSLGIGKNAFFDFIAVVGAVVHALNRYRELACQVTLIQQHRQLAHHQHRLHTTLEVGGIGEVTLLGDGEADHLKAGGFENFHKPGPVLRELEISLQTFGNGGHHPLFDGAVGLQQHQQAQVVIGTVSLVDDLVVETFGHDDAPVTGTAVQCLLQHGCREGPEDIACAEVDPGGFRCGFLTDSCYIKPGQLIPLFFPASGVKRTCADLREFHIHTPSLGLSTCILPLQMGAFFILTEKLYNTAAAKTTCFPKRFAEKGIFRAGMPGTPQITVEFTERIW